MELKKYIKIDWNTFNSLTHNTADECYFVGQGYIEFVDGAPQYKEITDVKEGYGRRNETWATYGVMIE